MIDPEIVKNFITWVLVICGWFIVARDHDRRARRAEIREILTASRDLVQKIEDNALSYWKMLPTDQTAEGLALEIKFEIKQLAGLIVALANYDIRFGLYAPLARFRQAVTGGNFEVKARTVEEPHSQRMIDICSTGLDVKEGLTCAFIDVYWHTRWPR